MVNRTVFQSLTPSTHRAIGGVVLVVVVLSVAAATPAAATVGNDYAGTAGDTATSVAVLDNCTTITTAGEYDLTSNIVDTSTDGCLRIESSDVVLDGGGNSVSDSASGDTGIAVAAGVSNVTVTNVSVRNWSTGIAAVNASDVTISDVAVEGNDDGIRFDNVSGSTVVRADVADTGYGYNLTDVSTSRVEDTTVVNASQDGIVVRGSSSAVEIVDASIDRVTEFGVRGTAPTSNVTVESTTVIDSGGGVGVAGGGYAVLNSTVLEPFVVGVQIIDSDGTTVRNVSVHEPDGHGIEVRGGSTQTTIERSFVGGATDFGIDVRDSANVEVRDSAAQGQQGLVFRNATDSRAFNVSLFALSDAPALEFVTNNTGTSADRISLVDADNNSVTVGASSAVDVGLDVNATPPARPAGHRTADAYAEVTTSSTDSTVDLRVYYRLADADDLNQSRLRLWGHQRLDTGTGTEWQWNEIAGSTHSMETLSVVGTVSTHGTYAPVAPVPEADTSPSSVGFGQVDLGSSATESVAVESLGALDLAVSNVSIAGPDAGHFRIVSNVTSPIAAGDADFVDVAFDADTVGRSRATLVVETNDTVTPTVEVPLSGTGDGPILRLEDRQLDVGDVSVAEATRTNLTVVNAGTSPLSVSDVRVESADGVSITVGASSFTVDPGERREVTVTLEPAAEGTFGGEITIESDDPARPSVAIPIEGAAWEPEIAVTDRIDFGEVRVDGTVTRNVTLRNPGRVETTIAGLSVDGDDAFSVETADDLTLAPGVNRTVAVTLAPTATGPANATLRVETTAGTTATTALSGTAVAPRLAVEPSERSLGTVYAGGEATAEVTVRNDGTAALSVADLSVTGSDAGAFSVGTDGFEVAPGEERSVAVTFAPRQPGEAEATLGIAAENDAASVALSGTAETPVELDSSVVDFGTVDLDDGPATRQVTIHNPSDDTVEVSGASITGDGAFRTAGTPGGPIQPGESRTLTLVFDPGSAGGYTATLAVETDAGSATATLTGVGGRPELAVTPGRLTYADASGPVTRTVTVSNDGDAPLSVTGIEVEGFDAKVDPETFTVPPGESREVTVEFDPSATETQNGTFRVQTIDGTATVPIVNPETTVEVDNETEGKGPGDWTVARVSYADPGESVRVPVETSTDGPAALTRVEVTPRRGGNFTVDATDTAERPTGTPAFDLGDGTVPAGFLRVDHDIADANISEVTLRFRVQESALNGSDPGDVALYRYADGSWNELPTRQIDEVDDAYVYRARSPGLSDFSAGVKKPQFRIADALVELQRQQADTGGIRVVARIRNDGGADGSYTVELLLNDEVVDSQTLTIAANGTRQATFQRAIDEPGTYEVYVNDQFVDEIDINASEAGIDDPRDGGAGSSNELLLLGLVFVIAVGTAVGATLWWRREQDAEE